jgi:hypothetical protein
VAFFRIVGDNRSVDRSSTTGPTFTVNTNTLIKQHAKARIDTTTSTSPMSHPLKYNQTNRYVHNTASDKDNDALKTEQRSLFDMFSFNIPLDRLPDVLSLLGHKKTIGNIVMPNTARKRMQKLFKVPSAIAANAKQVDEIAIANNTPIILSALEVSLIILLHLFHDMGKLNIAFSTRKLGDRPRDCAGNLHKKTWGQTPNFSDSPPALLQTRGGRSGLSGDSSG